MSPTEMHDRTTLTCLSTALPKRVTSCDAGYLTDSHGARLQIRASARLLGLTRLGFGFSTTVTSMVMVSPGIVYQP